MSTGLSMQYVYAAIAGILGMVGLLAATARVFHNLGREKPAAWEILPFFVLGKRARHPALAYPVNALYGAVFGIVYSILLTLFQAASVPGFLFYGAVLGVMHGAGLAPVVVLWFDEDEGDGRSLSVSSFASGLAIITGHVAYGAVTAAGLMILAALTAPPA